MQLQQTSIDTVDLETFGPVTLCTFHWAGKRKSNASIVSTPLANLLNTNSKKRLRPVDAASKLENLIALTDEGLDVVARLGPTGLFAIYQPLDSGYGADVPLYRFDDEKGLRELLSGRSDEDIFSRVFASYGGVALFNPESALDAPPLNLPVYFEISDLHVDVDRALPHLESHPLIKAVAHDDGRPGAFDHVPSFLKVVAALPDSARSKIEKDFRERYQALRKGERVAASPTNFSEALTWNLSSRPKAYGDPFGLSKFARKRNEYQAPTDDEFDSFDED
jgi:hypothetical protein